MGSRLLSISVLLAMLAGCAITPAPAVCGPGMGQPMRTFELYFGRAVAGRGDVTDTEWRQFVEGELSEALPAGFTVFDANGAWRNPRTGRTIHEATKVVVAVMPDSADSVGAVNRARAAYQSRFNQQLVGLNTQTSCGQF